jgi:SAM-dependent methyltransferase
MSACVLCGSSQSSELFRASDRFYGTTDEEFVVVRCGGCGLVRIDPQPAPADLARYYPRSYWFAPDPTAAGRLEEFYRRTVLRDHVNFVSRAMDGSGSRAPLLDVGAGGGLFLAMMQRRGFRVAALDNSAEAAAIAWKRQRVPSVCGLLEQVPLRAGHFGCVTMFHVLEHLYDPRAYLDAARELLEAGGRLVVQVPNSACWQFRLLGKYWNGVQVPRHLVNFRSQDVLQLVESCGFAVVRRKFFSLRDNPAGLATSVAPGLDPTARRVRGVRESGGMRLAKDLVYFALMAACLPFAIAEAACGAGSTVMIEARKR